ncbi:hypothetical protein V6N12_066255 [Hibiscus sabdariffa]|uniref:Uncharacterized protein n=1 Tax=Hibiscus sabdariffa TaxID=183260 RepID=A0ABR2ARR7_9ROSI
MSFSPIVVVVLKMFHEHACFDNMAGIKLCSVSLSFCDSEMDNDLQRDVIHTRNRLMLFVALRLAPSQGPTILDFLVCSCSAGFWYKISSL